MVAVLVPMALVLRNVALRQRLLYAGAGALTALVMIAPWVGFNLSRFSQPVIMSDDLGGTLAFANCRPAFYGRNIGFGDFKCLAAAQRGPPATSRRSTPTTAAWPCTTSTSTRADSRT